MLGSFYYGYAFLQLPSGCLALRLGGTRIFGYAIFLASMLTLLTPVATRYSVYGMIAVRAGEGLMLVRNNVFVLSQTKLNYEWLNVGLPNIKETPCDNCRHIRESAHSFPK